LEVNPSEYELVESILFDNRSNFNEKQKEFIELEETKTIIAGPGAGKTTALAAKIVLLLKQLNSIKSKSGICIITHTNVAVNEINRALVKAGIGEISHPHFIGTIHEFFNKYCVIPCFKSRYSHTNLLFDTQTPNDLLYYKLFLTRKLPWTNKNEGAKNFIAEKINSNSLYFNEENILSITNNSNWEKFDKYKDVMLEAKLTRKINGFLNYDDTFLFSKSFLKDAKYKDILRRRFKYIFLDEFQDTHPEGQKLLDDLFLTGNNIYQRLGDPYQTIGFDQSMPTISSEQVFNINLTNRFGKEIAEHLNIVRPESNIQVASEDKVSFKPILLIYDDEREIYPCFKNIIKDYEETEVEFRENKKQDKVLVLEKKWSSRVKSGVLYRDKKVSELYSKNYEIKQTIINYIVKKVVYDSGEKLSEVKDWIKKHPQMLSLNKLLVKLIKNGASPENIRDLKNQLNNLLEEKGATRINITNDIFRIIKDICTKERIKITENFEDDDIYTIHSVKGETLRSVLLVDLGNTQKNLVNVFLHKYNLIEEIRYDYIFQNLFYVALSRVTHLFVFAIEGNILNEDQISKLEDKWNIMRIESQVTVK